MLGPAFAIETVNARSCLIKYLHTHMRIKQTRLDHIHYLSVLTNSSSNSPPHMDSPPVPSPSGSPVYIIFKIGHNSANRGIYLSKIIYLYHESLYDSVEYQVIVVSISCMSLCSRYVQI